MRPVLAFFATCSICLAAAAASTHACAGALRLENAHRAMWKMHDALSLKAGKRGSFNQGTAFAIGPKRMLTAFHLLLGFVEPDGAPGHIEDHIEFVRTHVEESRALRVKRVLAVDLAHDLALLETEKGAGGYLDFADGDLPAPDERLNILGYRGRAFAWMKPARGVAYANDFFFLVPTGTSELKGLSGGALVTGEGRVAGMAFYANANMLFAVRPRHIRSFAAGKTGTRCDLRPNLNACLMAGVEDVRRMAANGHLLAQFELGRDNSFVTRIDKGTEPNVALLERAADRGLAWAAFKLAFRYIRGIGVGKDLGEAFRYIERAAKQGFPPAMYWAGRFLGNGWGVPKTPALGDYWMSRAAGSGYAVAETDPKRDR
ncbi:MAG: bifunctional trypsin-like peptidase domain-containing/SEL1-like repeat protein [Rhodospirillaceae bacterium]|nr:bifunctional trypsin-like peptidase domain-containing/SEL1-like repeat protein [Rhodospirillaceae bacterium]MYK14921.1 bifunctional trypsin-like peptidase domain-containing/SEL1-like repeat protein [Rhodospirillaceae bacterium]MYK60184.1 bifunctional trypsin-like peptidase domain-containing/SEL1-like repeat protein [Rhodospirillaceae bacterium]